MQQPCPACGGENPPDTIFCAHCRKSLGEFRFVREEFEAAQKWYEKLADRVTAFVGRPHFFSVHVFWFGAWIMLNTGMFAVVRHFDSYPFNLLGILLAIEAIFITGFLLISQNREARFEAKRAELDYEVNVRTFRKVNEIEARVTALQEQLSRVEHALTAARKE